MTWLDAWTSWWAGNAIAGDTEICGITLRWWNRYGQIAQLAGAFLLVVDVIGPERLRREAAIIRFFNTFKSEFTLIDMAKFSAMALIGLGAFAIGETFPLPELLDKVRWIFGVLGAASLPSLCFMIVNHLIDGIAWVLQLRIIGILTRIASWSLILWGSTLVLLAS